MEKRDKMKAPVKKEIKSIWVIQERENSSKETLYGDSDLFDLDDNNFLNNDPSEENVHSRLIPIQNIQDKLEIVALEAISIEPTKPILPQILNLKQCFTIPPPYKPNKEVSVQTSKIQLLVTRKQTNISLANYKERPQSHPPDMTRDTNFLKMCIESEQNSKNLGDVIGDGLKNKIVKPNEEFLKNGIRKPDLELGVCFPPNPVQCIFIKPKNSRQLTPVFNCKKFIRPQTRNTRIARGTEQISNKVFSSILRAQELKKQNENYKEENLENSQTQIITKKTENLLKTTGNESEMSTDLSTDSGLDACGNLNAKLSDIVDKFQDHNWEICLEGLQQFKAFGAVIDWESELGMKFVPIISRKLIDFFKSPRSNLCRTACQTAGEFFVMAKSTKRPEFDEMVDILLCKTADPNRFIQKDANVALDKMATHICMQHSVRAVCVKGPDHKNPIVRAMTARLLLIICKTAGVDQIIGSDANPRTRKRVLQNLAKFLMDKNHDTRRHAERLTKLLKKHKFFMEYFLKDVENNFKVSLRKILNSLDGK